MVNKPIPHVYRLTTTAFLKAIYTIKTHKEINPVLKTYKRLTKKTGKY